MNRVVHWELFAPDALTLARFYEALFGWALELIPDIGYVHIDTCAGAGSADDLESTLDHIDQAGGTTTLPPLHEVVTFAQFADTEGNIVGLVKRGDESTVSEGDKPPVSRFRLSATDPTALVGFYRQVFGWRARPGTLPDGASCLEVDTGPGGIAGAIGGSSPGSHAVMFSVAVEDLGTFVERARALGAAAGPTEESEAAYVVDPAGQTLELLSSRHTRLSS